MTISIQEIRESYIKGIDTAENQNFYIRNQAKNLFALDLTVYTKDNSFESILYNEFSKSQVDSNISLHPEQIRVLNLIKENKGTILSAPTSFGKTLIMFEYIIREQPNNVFLVVPTLALVDEYNRKIIKNYQQAFAEYNIHFTYDPAIKYSENKKNIFIITHDRIIEYSKIDLNIPVDLLVIDEVYKLKKGVSDDRVLIFNIAYYNLVIKAGKHILLAPFIGGVENIEELPFQPQFIKSDFSPVVNEVITINVQDESERQDKSIQILSSIDKKDKNLVYFPTVTKLAKYCYNDYFVDLAPASNTIESFLIWLKEEFSPEWYVVKCLEKGVLVHNGQLPVGIRNLELELFENEDYDYNILLSTSTLLEGVNTVTKNIIITEASRFNKPFDSFDFYNLVGRSGRLNKYYVGKAYYIKAPDDFQYTKEEASKRIEFELTDTTSVDIDIHIENNNDQQEFNNFLKESGIDKDSYLENIGPRYRLSTISELFDNYLKNRKRLLSELNLHLDDNKRGKYNIVLIIHSIINGRDNRLDSSLISDLLNRRRLKVSTVLLKATRNNEFDADFVISKIMRLKNGYIEHDFYSKLLIIIYYLVNDKIPHSLISVLEDKIKHSIEILYFTDSNQKKMLKDIGVYESDVDKIIEVIGTDYSTINELLCLLREYYTKLKKISFISRYSIQRLI